ncbi:16S rRNA (uracil(1498)-N(3))-methyltransferase [Echinicola vietnamensis]|uniref:Ribosomal RNA small subunit methyltransferase E n=1 Tax=Echinicola vietnamensis (strain DSM 17526 / LMG 23754 / KMM 6221) TaxID=926556 RepID=L0G1V1_ECHVK|nr:16S rRNA (uracil(1498)-N(3))-methyltransferase [Echinicola vietnamensis]AGA79293.1 RNA methyltransferase, RsmE family [Echinicola vietnamensis DSM 17526]
MQLFYQKDIPESGNITLHPEESKHLVKVLRKNVGDEVFMTDGKGHLFSCQITKGDLKRAELSIIEKKATPLPDHHIHLAIAPTKNTDRMEWMLEKITEIGFSKLTFIKTSNSERSFLKPDRLEKKMVSACKQSLKTHFPIIDPLTSFEELLDKHAQDDLQKFIAYVDENHRHHLFEVAKAKGAYLILIGPEGDFSPEEINLAKAKGFIPVSLGHSRLRTETAGLAAVHTLSLLNN